MSISDASIRPAPPLLFLAMRPLPLAPLQPLLSFLIASIVRRHRGLFARLGPHAGKDPKKMLQPEDIAHAVAMLVTQAPQSFVSEILIRPTQKP